MSRRRETGRRAEDPHRPRAAGAPPAVRRAAAVVALEGLALAAIAVFYATRPLVSPARDLLGAELGALLAFGAAVALLVLGRALAAVAGWARAPTVVMQLLALPVGFSLAFQAGLYLYGLPVLALAITVLYQLATPEARLAFADA